MKITVIKDKANGRVVHAVEGHLEFEVLKVNHTSVGEALIKEDSAFAKEMEEFVKAQEAEEVEQTPTEEV